ncbi:galactosylgalactosylxylosylprotein 3-beta-glucuronosyltransferase S-like [Penaeus vannamei]|uniref:galactosylgalactosylxylosylprotein 3-beta-glucuronosyltransferase S-like n=1 Tax=Penaeus vannamei TaxID=6689 RepID=UPI00387FACCC
MAVMAPRREQLYFLFSVSIALAVLTLLEFSDRDEGGGRARRGLQDSTRGSTGRTIYVITGTYKRSNQIPEMTHLAQTLMLVPDVHWIVAEDTRVDNERLIQYLLSTGISFTYLKTPMPRQLLKWRHPPKGVPNRRAALSWIRKNAKTGVVYFADDDNTYDYRLFEEIRSTRGVSMFPVGFVTRLQLSTPVVKGGRFAGWYDGWVIDRKFPVDMAAFAFSVELLQKRPRANMAWSYDYQEESILASPLELHHRHRVQGQNQTLDMYAVRIWVWHTKSVKPMPAARDLCDARYDGTNLRFLEGQMELEGTACRPRSQPQEALKEEGQERQDATPLVGAEPTEKFGMDYEN